MSVQFFYTFLTKNSDNCTWKCENNLDKMVYAYLTPDFRKHISRELWYIFVVHRQRICSHFLVQIPRADAEIVTNKLPLFFYFFINMLLLYFNVQYTNAYFLLIFTSILRIINLTIDLIYKTYNENL
jgi:hypothetical protein